MDNSSSSFTSWLKRHLLKNLFPSHPSSLHLVLLLHGTRHTLQEVVCPLVVCLPSPSHPCLGRLWSKEGTRDLFCFFYHTAWCLVHSSSYFWNRWAEDVGSCGLFLSFSLSWRNSYVCITVHILFFPSGNPFTLNILFYNLYSFLT